MNRLIKDREGGESDDGLGPKGTLFHESDHARMLSIQRGKRRIALEVEDPM